MISAADTVTYERLKPSGARTTLEMTRSVIGPMAARTLETPASKNKIESRDEEIIVRTSEDGEIDELLLF